MKNTTLLLLWVACMFIQCKSKEPLLVKDSPRPWIAASQETPFLDIVKKSNDITYGFVSENPIKTGAKSTLNQRRFLASLAGPNGEEVYFYKEGSCCSYESEDGVLGIALIDIYKVTYEGLETPLKMYINRYEDEPLLIPIGFTHKPVTYKRKTEGPNEMTPFAKH